MPFPKFTKYRAYPTRTFLDTPFHTLHLHFTTMHLPILVLTLASLAAAAPANVVARQSSSVDISGSYWDATIRTQTGRPGYTIRDLTSSFRNPRFEQIVGGTCHYSFVPQGTSAPAVTDTCDAGLTYTWDCEFEHASIYAL